MWTNHFVFYRFVFIICSFNQSIFQIGFGFCPRTASGRLRHRRRWGVWPLGCEETLKPFAWMVGLKMVEPCKCWGRVLQCEAPTNMCNKHSGLTCFSNLGYPNTLGLPTKIVHMLDALGVLHFREAPIWIHLGLSQLGIEISWYSPLNCNFGVPFWCIYTCVVEESFRTWNLSDLFQALKGRLFWLPMFPLSNPRSPYVWLQILLLGSPLDRLFFFYT